MYDNIIYSQTTRVVGEKNNIKNFKLGIKRIENSRFKYANLSFSEIQELLDKDNYREIFDDLIDFLNNSSIIFNIAHAPIHYPFFFNAYYKRDDIDILKNRILKSIDISKQVGVKRIVIHVGTYLDENYNYSIEKSIEHNIKYLEPFVKKAVESNILIAIENGTQMEKDDPLFKDTAPYIDELIKIVEYYNKKYNKEVLGICFDFGHANVGKLDMYKEILKVGSKLIVTHIHDNYGTDTHNQPFDGTVNWNEVRRGLIDINYDGELTSEVRYTKEELSDSMSINQTYDLIKKIYKDD
ncbi:MAG: sugar phosphate isomerase/epimerase [Clostridia bacterium]|nr:sugar phosphate isomerase/epimerase [Clostridia bacterium]